MPPTVYLCPGPEAFRADRFAASSAALRNRRSFDRIARFTAADVERLLQDPGIVRHRGKIAAVINNARCAQELVEREGSIAVYVWRFEPKASELAAPQTASVSAASIAMSKDLKKRGWSFVGPTTVYAFMQAMGLINDHVEGCVIQIRRRHPEWRSSVPLRPVRVKAHQYIPHVPGSRF